jgi:hypothetical protein
MLCFTSVRIRRRSDYLCCCVQPGELQLGNGAVYGQHIEALRPAVPPSLLITPAASPHTMQDNHELEWEDWLEMEDAIVPPANVWAYPSYGYAVDSHGKIGMFHPSLPLPNTPVKPVKRDNDRIMVDCSGRQKKSRPALDIQVPGTPGTLLAGSIAQLQVRSPVSHGNAGLPVVFKLLAG